MNWSDERFVRLYVRDTADWMAMCWQARACLPLIMRKLDRAGVFDLGRSGLRGLAGLIGMPLEVVEPGVADLLADGCLVQRDGCLVMPNFLEAQEATQSDAHRQRESRGRRRAAALASDVTKRDSESQNVTERHAESRAVTLTLPVPCLPVPEDPDRPVEPPQLELVRTEPAVDVAAVHDAAYATYPASRRTGKAKGLESLRASVRTPDDAQRFARVVSAHLASASEDKFVRHWERICATWTQMPDVAPARASPDPRRGSVRPLAAHEYPVGDQEI